MTDEITGDSKKKQRNRYDLKAVIASEGTDMEKEMGLLAKILYIQV